MTELSRRVLEARAGGSVERCHTVRHIGSYNNATHSWGVAMLMHYLWPNDFQRLALVCLSHDVPERLIGDIPAPPLRVIPGLRESVRAVEGKISNSIGLPSECDLSADDYRKLKACDHLELWIWCNEQIAMGNLMVLECVNALESIWADNPLPKEAEDLRQAIMLNGVVPDMAMSALENLL